MLKEIGSNFWLSQDGKDGGKIDSGLFNTFYQDVIYTSSGRGAISVVLSDLEINSKRVLLPSFTCETVIEPFLNHGYDVSYYEVEKNLVVNIDKFLSDVKNYVPDIILVHNYFGFDTTLEIRTAIEELKESGIIIIEDLTQNLYSNYKRLSANYYVGSFRKWAGIPEGGFALKSKGNFKNKPNIYDNRLLESKVVAMKAKYDYIFCDIGDKEDYLKMYSEAEDILNDEKEIFKMSDYSYNQQANLDIDNLVKRRRDNYNHLLKNIKNTKIKPLFYKLSSDVVPLYFPIICEKERFSLQNCLRKNQVYAPIVWPKPNCITDNIENADYFYNNLLCIPCDQRYGYEEMNRVIELLNSWK